MKTTSKLSLWMAVLWLGQSAQGAEVITIPSFDPATFFSGGITAGIDFNDGSPTQSGFAGIAASNNKTYDLTTGGITFDIDVINANQTNQNRDRGGTNGDLVRDFEQWYGIWDDPNSAVEASITMTGLIPESEYQISFFTYNAGAGQTTHHFHQGTSSAGPLVTSFTTSGNSSNVSTWSPGITIETSSGLAGSISITIRANQSFITTTSKYESRLTLDGVSVKYIGPAIPTQPLEITNLNYNKDTDQISLTWKSNPDEFYGLYWSDDLESFESNIDPAIPAAVGEFTTTYGPFASPVPGSPRLFFRVGPPDFQDPVLSNVAGNGSTITIRFSEPMSSGPATDLSNYIITLVGGGTIELSSVELSEDGTTVTLTTAAPMGPGTAYTVAFQNLTDRAGRALPPGTTDGFATWDNNPNGVKVFILAGQSNMQGHGWHDDRTDNGIDEDGTIRKMIVNDAGGTYDYLLDGSGNWVTRSDVQIYTVDGNRNGALTVGYGVDSTKTGAEYGFGWRVGDLLTDDVLIIKTCWGGKSLKTDFRPPSAVVKRGGVVGPYYNEIVSVVSNVLENIGNYVPGYAGQGYQIAGFGWHQGWNDRVDQSAVDEYEENLVDFINDIRFDLGGTVFPFVVANTGIGGPSETNTRALALMQAQLNVGNGTLYPAFDGNVASVETRPFWRDASISPITNGSQGFHWNQNGETMFLIGDAMGASMVGLLTAP